MIEEATAENIEALDLEENELEGQAEEASNSAMDEANFSYMEDPEPQDGVNALRAARGPGSTEENTNPAMLDEELPDRMIEDEDSDPVGNDED